MKRLASVAAVASALTVAGPAIAGPFVSLPREDGTSKVGIDMSG
jgi:hypothetical protein